MGPFKVRRTKDEEGSSSFFSSSLSSAFSTAFSEQLGLKIEQQRVPVEMLVIDSAERPSAN
jgi:uncharacterized protein (TIGR03435 family)